MSSKAKARQGNSKILKSYEECLKKGIPPGKKYGSDFADGFIVKRYIYPPYSWYTNRLSSNNKHDKSQKSMRTSQKKVKMKSKSLQRSKSKPKRKQRTNSRKR